MVFLSPQIYVHHGIHDFIFNFVGTLEASQVGLTLLKVCDRNNTLTSCCSLTGCCLQQNHQESAGAAAERSGRPAWVQVSSHSFWLLEHLGPVTESLTTFDPFDVLLVLQLHSPQNDLKRIMWNCFRRHVLCVGATGYCGTFVQSLTRWTYAAVLFL